MRSLPVLRSLALIAAASTLGGAVGCSSENTSAPPAAPVDWHAFDVPHAPIAEPVGPTARERAAADSYAAAISSPDMAALVPMLDGYAHFQFPGGPDVRGKEGVAKAHQTLFGAFDRRVMALSRVWRTDAELSLEWTMTGLQAREWMGVAPTNRPVTFRGITLLFTKDDGTVTDIHTYFDAAVVKTQLGAGPKELATLGLVPATMPSGAPVIVDQAHSPEETRNAAAARAVLDALEKNEEATYLASLTDDVVIEMPEHATPLRGKDEARASIRQMHKSIGQLDTTLDNAWAVGPFVIVEYFVSGEQVGPVGWVAPQRDRPFRIEVVDILEMHDARIAHMWRYSNPGQLLSGRL